MVTEDFRTVIQLSSVVQHFPSVMPYIERKKLYFIIFLSYKTDQTQTTYCISFTNNNTQSLTWICAFIWQCSLLWQWKILLFLRGDKGLMKTDCRSGNMSRMPRFQISDKNVNNKTWSLWRPQGLTGKGLRKTAIFSISDGLKDLSKQSQLSPVILLILRGPDSCRKTSLPSFASVQRHFTVRGNVPAIKNVKWFTNHGSSRHSLGVLFCLHQISVLITSQRI